MNHNFPLLVFVAVERLQQSVEDLFVLLHRQVVDRRLRELRRNVAKKGRNAFRDVVDLGVEV